MRFLGIDYGKRRTGLAVSSPDEYLALPYETLSGDPATLLDRLSDIALRERIDQIVLGLPLTLEGEETALSREVTRFAGRLANRLRLPVWLVNEALTSFEAEEELRNAGMSAKKIKVVVDRVAAVKLLTTFLRERRGVRVDPA